MITAKLTKENAAKLIGTRCAMKSNPRSFLGYKRIIDTEEYAVFEQAASVVAAYGDIVVKRRGNTLFYIPNVRAPFLNYRIELCDRNFPGLIQGSNFMQCLLLPYMRVVKQDTYVKDVRLCIFTDKAKFIITSRQEIKIVKTFQNLEIVSNLKKVLFGICRGENIQHLIITFRNVNAIIRGCQTTAILIHLV